MDSPFQEVPGTPLLDRTRSNQSPVAVVPVGIRGRPAVSEPLRSVSRFIRTSRSVASPFVVPNVMSPITPRQMVEGTPRSLIVSPVNRQTPNGASQRYALNRTSRRRQIHGTPLQEIKGTPIRQTHQAIPRQILRSSGIASKLPEQVVPSTPKQQTDEVFSTPRTRSQPASKKTISTTCTGNGNTPNVEIHNENLIIMDATGDHHVGSNMEQTGKMKTKVSRQRRILIPREKSQIRATSDILDNIE